MNSVDVATEHNASQAPESADEWQRRMALEATDIAASRASAAAGRVVDSAQVKTWIDSIGTAQELPVPYSGR